MARSIGNTHVTPTRPATPPLISLAGRLRRDQHRHRTIYTQPRKQAVRTTNQSHKVDTQREGIPNQSTHKESIKDKYYHSCCFHLEKTSLLDQTNRIHYLPNFLLSHPACVWAPRLTCYSSYPTSSSSSSPPCFSTLWSTAQSCRCSSTLTCPFTPQMHPAVSFEVVEMDRFLLPLPGMSGMDALLSCCGQTHQSLICVFWPVVMLCCTSHKNPAVLPLSGQTNADSCRVRPISSFQISKPY